MQYSLVYALHASQLFNVKQTEIDAKFDDRNTEIGIKFTDLQDCLLQARILIINFHKLCQNILETFHVKKSHSNAANQANLILKLSSFEQDSNFIPNM